MISKIHYISQSRQNGSHLDAIEKVLQAGGKWIQLRVKNQSQDEILSLAIKANALCEAHDAKLIVNDYPEIARESGAYGLHLGLDDMPIPDARRLVGDKMIIGGTANTFEHILKRIEDGADYVGLGPYRFTSTKEKLSPIIGSQGYRDIMRKVQHHGITVPIVAIGGIELEDIPLLLEIGLYGVAVSGALTKDAQQLVEMQNVISSSQYKKKRHVENSR